MKRIDARALDGGGLLITAMVALGCAAPGAALAQAPAYPVKPIRMIVAYAPGGFNDILGRMAARKIADAVGQSVVVENRPGAEASIGINLVAKSPPDGYVLGMGSGNLTILPHLVKSLPYDPLRDFAPVSNTAFVPYVVCVNVGVPAKTVQELIAIAARRKGFLSYASGASTSRLATEMFKSMAKVDIVYVPYRGTAPALIDVAGGQVDMMIADQGLVRPLARTGKLRMLATTGLKRLRILPELPTVAEAGLRGYEIASWSGVMAPAGTPQEIVNRLYRAVAAGMRAPDLQPVLDELGYEASGNTPEQFTAMIRDEYAKFAKVVRDAGITAEP